MATTVDVPPAGRLRRSVGLVVVRPADFRRHADGLARYARSFNRQLGLARRRASRTSRDLDAVAGLPPRLAGPLLRRAMAAGTAFGSVGLTVLRDARVFAAPIGDAGHDRGFIAVGNVGLPTERGPPVGCVTIKGATEHIGGLASTLVRALRFHR